MRINSLVAAFVLAGAVAVPAQADVLGVKVGLDIFSTSTDGSFANADADFNDETHFSGYVAFEHPIPLLPNAMVRYTDLSDSDNGSKLDLSNADLVLYYELLDNPALELDVGLDYRIYMGEADAADMLKSKDLDEGALMGYVRGRFNLIGTGLFAYADIVATDYDDKAISDYQLGVGYTFGLVPLIDMTVKAGFREHSFDVSKFNGISADVTQDGWFGGVEVAF
ncbi:TIGR04219 family outer membrane beta-barrel protein [Ferrimonas lipolytica]|uniref:TIGR04219 family outer membrane beta-barrel protein n=1 Tax=Ferrimonas lipolytica TaxID=2724191 RepID=A0A6H1UFA0_9GAMM|nr:TIGR04219 family outer membrane beta-barrel protein [Ferrimonas lipolytica]QIZ77777.1 TIGR04219 family outer membrane beta-barrel protein [Ferrimonas lipolytica]